MQTTIDKFQKSQPNPPNLTRIHKSLAKVGQRDSDNMRLEIGGEGGFDLDISRISHQRSHKPAPTDPIPQN